MDNFIFFMTLMITTFLISFQILLIGRIGVLKFLNFKNYHHTIDYIFGIFLISNFFFICNFFISLNKTFNTIILILPFFYLFFLDKKTLLKFFKYSLIFSLFTFFLISYDTVNKPDGGLYHLPFTSLINENKIIIGSANLHFRFGHTSIIQYLDAGYNNLLFNEIGLLIPRCIFLFSILLYFFSEIKKNLKSNNNNFAILSLIILFQILYDMNRYSYLGNDIPAHIIVLFTSYFFFKNYLSRYNTLLLIFCLCIFSFQLKSTLILFFLLPIIYVILFKKFFKFLLNFKNFFPILIIFLWVLKNILISGCAIFPLKTSCLNNVYWNSSLLPSQHHNVEKVSIENEAWAKGWPDRDDPNLSYSEYIESNWIKIWSKNHFKNVVIKKLLPLILIIIFIYFFIKKRSLKFRRDKNKINNLLFKKSLILNLIFFLGSIIWFIKFPTYRYGSSLIIGLIIFFNPKLFNYNFLVKDLEKKICLFFILSIFFIVCLKYINKIDTKKSFLPNIYSYNFDVDKPLKFKKIFKNKKFYYYDGEGKLCMYSLSPCTNLETHEKLSLKEKFGYKVFYLDLN